jgi:glucose-1-phosphate cytidylyltransferase
VTLVDTGENTMTGGRLKRVEKYIGDDDFCFTYGDGLSNVNISDTIEFHKKEGRLATLTGVQPPGRFGALNLSGNSVTSFKEKPHGDGSWINGGFFVLSPKVIDLIDDDSTVWEKKPMESLAAQDQMSAYLHRDFWQPLDTLREKNQLEELWRAGDAPWKIWL